MTSALETAAAKGLEGVVAAESTICYVFGAEGRLIYRGYDIADLAAHSTFEETSYLLLNGDLPTRAQLREFTTEIKAAQKIDRAVQRVIKDAPRTVDPMSVLRTAVSAAVFSDPDAADHSAHAERRKAVRLIAQLPTILATIYRLRTEQRPLAPRRGLSLAANFLYMLFGQVPSWEAERAFDAALILHADHELNASTFAARVTAATLSDIHSSITSAIGALKGPLHGGANEDVIRMLLEVGEPDKAVERVHDMFARKVKIPGFGHRVYRTEDPRATHLRVLSAEVGRRTGHTQLYSMSQRVEQTVNAEKKLNANVDFYSASTYYSLGIPIDLFTPVFAISRMSGWTAHVLEQYRNNRLIRPRAEYKGNPDGMPWVPIENR